MLNIHDNSDHTKIKPLPLMATFTTPTNQLPFAASFDNGIETPPLPSPLKNIFRSSNRGDLLSPESSPTKSEDIILPASPSPSLSPTPTSQSIQETPLKTPRVELNPRFLMHTSNAMTSGLGEETVKQKPESDKEKSDAVPGTAATGKIIPRLWTKDVSSIYRNFSIVCMNTYLTEPVIHQCSIACLSNRKTICCAKWLDEQRDHSSGRRLRKRSKSVRASNVENVISITWRPESNTWIGRPKKMRLYSFSEISMVPNGPRCAPFFMVGPTTVSASEREQR